jgi:hypothetical protein
MASITATGTRTGDRRWHWGRTREALVRAGRRTAHAVDFARQRYRRPVLVIGSFASAVASAWHTFGTGAGLAALCAAGLLFELLGGDE